jgi:hypothetical protein
VASAVQQTGADRQQAAAGGGGGGGGGAAGSSAPVAAAVSLQLVTNVGSWMSVTGKGVQASVHATSNVQASVTSDPYGFYLANQEKWALVAPMARGLNFGVMAWNALRPVFGLVERFSGGFGVEHQVQGLLAQADPTGGVASVFSHASVAPNSGDPYVQWVDQILYNNGQPLTAGSAPLYGTYWDGQGHSAGEALSMAAPFVEGGVYLVAGMWMVGPAGLAGLAGPALGAAFGAGTELAVNAAGGGTAGMAVSGFGQGFFWGAVQGSVEAAGGLVGELGSEAAGAGSWDGALGKGEQRLADLGQGGALTEARGFSASELMAEEGCWAAGACFAAGTPLLTPMGDGLIEALRPGDWVLAAPDGDPERAAEPRQVEKVFVRQARLLELRVAGRVIRTTAPHRFWVRGAGWRAGYLLEPGDELRGHDGRWSAVEAVADLGEEETVYNLRVADYHTYFVGRREWGFSVWAHNQYNNKAEFLTGEGPFKSPQEADAAWQSFQDVGQQMRHEGEPFVVKAEGSEFEKMVLGVKHGNDLLSDEPAIGYTLRDRDTGRILKYGETTYFEDLPGGGVAQTRYPQTYLEKNNAEFWLEARGTKAQMHEWQNNRILEYMDRYGERPGLNRTNW